MLEEFKGANVKGLAVWVPVMADDSIETARLEAARFEGLPVTHAWDNQRQLGNLFARTLGLTATAWDVYLLYGSGTRWYGDLPPVPAFWMHQLPASAGADGDMTLYPKRLSDELVKLLGDGVENTQFSCGDLGLQLHCKGLMNLVRGTSRYTMEDIQDALKEC